MISLKQITKSYDGHPAVDNLSLDIAEGELLVLLGKSGSGKTTTLKMINRLIEPDAGDIHISGSSIMDAVPEQLRRNIGYVIQDTGLFPHYTVAENIALVPRLLGWAEDRISGRVSELLHLTGLSTDLSGRYPEALSGGQRQRVGIARALAANPPVVLLDEPFGALDPITRRTLQKALPSLRSKEKHTMVMVTHDMTEAVMLADRICLMDGGRIQQTGTPFEMIFHPKTPFVSSFFDDFRLRLELMVTPLAWLKDYFPEEDAYRKSGELPAYATVFDLFEELEAAPEENGKRLVSIEDAQYSLDAPDLIKAFYKWRTEYGGRPNG